MLPRSRLDAIAALLALAVSFHGVAARPAQARIISGCVSQALAGYAKKGSSSRDRQANAGFWTRYKNDPRFATWVDHKADAEGVLSYDGLRTDPDRKVWGKASELALENAQKLRNWEQVYDTLPERERAAIEIRPATLDLRDPCGGDACKLQVVVDRYGNPGHVMPESLSNYEQNILHLRQGDSVRYGDKTYKLGKFLGAGNTTHVWEIEGEPDKALRLPFLSMNANRFHRDHLSLATIRQFMARLKTPPRLKLKRIEVFATGEHGEFAVVSRIHGTLNGDEFRAQYPGLIQALTKARESPGAVDLAKLGRAYGLTTGQTAKVANQLERLDALRPLYEGMPGAGDIAERQFIWDENEEDWILADW